jgi:hypothetical protein
LAAFGLINSAIGIVLFALGSRLLPAIDTGLIGSLDQPLAPIWVRLAFGETPTTATLIGGLIVFGAVFAHVLVSARGPSAAPRKRRPERGRHRPAVKFTLVKPRRGRLERLQGSIWTLRVLRNPLEQSMPILLRQVLKAGAPLGATAAAAPKSALSSAARTLRLTYP